MPIMAPGQQIPPQQIQMVPIPNLAPGAAGAPAPAAAPPPALASFKDQGALRAGTVTSAHLFAYCRSKIHVYMFRYRLEYRKPKYRNSLEYRKKGLRRSFLFSK